MYTDSMETTKTSSETGISLEYILNVFQFIVSL